jgi:superfamily II DNA or RNA helicase
MTIQELIDNDLTSITKGVAGLIDKRAFSGSLKQLSKFDFWAKSSNGKGRLWSHQITAIETTLAYLSAGPHLPERPLVREAALLKLPTGTGKSGVVAVLARCVRRVKRTLILTPRQSLVEQMGDDVRFRFWGHLGYPVVDGSTFTAEASGIGADLGDAFFETLLPTRADKILKNLPVAERSILVGTYQALDLIRRSAKDEHPERAKEQMSAQALIALLATFDLIVVDEGHYEPAISWSKGVRDLNRPTVLLSATPYRNDFKSFRVGGRFVYNFPYQQAVNKRIIRDIRILPTGAGHKGSATTAFVSGLGRDLPPLLKRASAWTATPKVMIRAATLDVLRDLQPRVDREFGTRSVLVHDRIAPSERRERRYQSARQAMRECADATYWLHQFKLMEGVDDPNFVAIALFDLPTNGRQLVQQIGRVIRTSRGSTRSQVAWVLAGTKNAQRIETTWTRYKGYEVYCAAETNNIVVNEIALPNRLLALMPDNQYVGGNFRNRFDAEGALAWKDLQIPATAAVFKWEGKRRALPELKEAVEDALLQEDRFRVVPLQGLPDHCIGFTYYAWRNSPLLRDQFFSEWRLGLFLAIQHGDLVLMQDTEGLTIDVDALGLNTAPRNLLEKAFPASGSGTRISRMSFGSLDMAPQAIRTLSVRTRSFETTFTDLLDPNLVPTAASGFVARRGRYIGFARARFRDSTESPLSLDEYLRWTKAIAKELTQTNQRSDVFARYAMVRDDITPDGAAPKTILMNLATDELVEETEARSDARAFASDPNFDHDDLCSDVNADGEFTISVLGQPVACQIEYVPGAKRYKFQSPQLDKLLGREERGDKVHVPTPSQEISSAQNFRLLVAAPNVVYAEKQFFQSRPLKLPDGRMPILDDVHAISALAGVKSEKGELLFKDRTRWLRESVFGIVEAICSAQEAATRKKHWEVLGQSLGSYPLVICDDDKDEITDFIAVDAERRKVAFIHAKVSTRGSKTYNVDSLQAVGRQATASLAYLVRGAPSGRWDSSRWNTDVLANTVKLEGRNRMFKNADKLTSKQISEALSFACGNPAYDREVWIVAGNIVDRRVIAAHIGNDTVDNRLRQLLMNWDALRTACARAGSRLKLFCH